MVSSEIILLLNVGNKSFSFKYSHLRMHPYLLLLHIFYIPLYNKDYHKFLPYWAQYIFGLHQMIFAFADQNQQQLVLHLNSEPYEQ